MAKPWADGPYQLMSTPKSKLKAGETETRASEFATEMANVHNMLIRAVNCIVLQAPHVTSPADVSDFLTFCTIWSTLVHEHHDAEEAKLFPLIVRYSGVEGIMDANVQQHKVFHAGLAAFDRYVRDVKEGRETYDGKKIVELVDLFADDMFLHLKAEIPTLHGLSEYDIDWDVIREAVTEYLNKDLVPETHLPIVTSNTDQSFEGGIHVKDFPPVPAELMTTIRDVFSKKYESVWRFSCCDVMGKRKELEFVP